MNQITTSLFMTIISSLSSCEKEESTITEETSYEINENSTYRDFLTPNYYNTNEVGLRDEINKFVHYARLVDFQNPFQNSNGEIASYSTNREFGDGIGLDGTSQHHPAIDLHLVNNLNLELYAAHDGIAHTFRDSPKYRHYLTITKDIKDSENITIGKLVSIYAHIDLDLDENESIQLDDLQVSKGDLVSKNLYNNTMGGPHLHFEIRYYRSNELGNEEFYSWQNSGEYTTQSTGIWSYGYWNHEIGYGFGDPMNHGIE